MHFDDRRSFLKNTFWGGLLSSLGISTIDKNWSDKALGLNVSSFRDHFLLKKDLLYLNTASLGPSPISVIEEFEMVNRELESISETGRYHYERVRKLASVFFNCSEDEICFTRNATEGINIIANGLNLQEGDEVILSTHEHVGGAVPWMNLVKKKGIKLKLVELDLSGERNEELIKSSITEKTRVLFLSHVCCTTGMILPIEELGKYCKERNIFTCIDGAQAPGMLKVDLTSLKIDAYAASGHKWLFGPKGTGILYINANSISKLEPTFAGAYTNDRYNLKILDYTYRTDAKRTEYGTRNGPLIAALGKAIEFHQKFDIDKTEKYGKDSFNYIRDELKNHSQVNILSPNNVKYHSSILSFRSEKISYQEIQKKLRQDYNIRVRGIYENDLNAIRVSCALFNSREDLKYFIDAIDKILV